MEQLLKSVLLMSGVGAVLIVILFLFKPLTKRFFGSSWQYYIWLAVLIVMVLPVKFHFPVHSPAPNTARPIQTQQPQTVPGQQEAAPRQPAALPEVQPLDFGQTIAGAEGVWAARTKQIGMVWLLGAAIFFMGGVISYIRFLYTLHRHAVPVSCPELERIKARRHIKRKIRVKKTKLLNAPLMVGACRPTLLLPDRELTEGEMDFVLLHELTHYKRRDLWYKWFAFLVNAVHWFNPFVYLAVRQINEECEISCDLSVTKNLSEEGKKGYMTTIINLASEKKGGKSHV